MKLKNLKEKVLDGKQITRDEAIFLYDENLEELLNSAEEIRKTFCGNAFDICTIINAKSGRCSENCKFCAQSIYYKTNIKTYELLPNEVIIEDAKKQYKSGILRYSMVSSGKKLSSKDIDRVCEIALEINREVPIKICISGGLLSDKDYQKLKAVGIDRVHNNLETSKEYFKNVCSTHSYEEKINAIKQAQKVGMEVCSGGIIGLGETREDRIDMALELRKLGIHSVPINVLNPIANTPYEKNPPLSQEEINRTIAIFRFLLPHAAIRLAGGRSLMEGMGKMALKSGANAAISGDLLTTHGSSVQEDLKMIEELGFEIKIIS